MSGTSLDVCRYCVYYLFILINFGVINWKYAKQFHIIINGKMNFKYLHLKSKDIIKKMNVIYGEYFQPV